MNLRTKRQLRQRIDIILKFTAIYAVLPSICIAIICFLFFVRSVGAADIQVFAARLGEEKILERYGSTKGAIEEGFLFINGLDGWMPLTPDVEIKTSGTYRTDYENSVFSMIGIILEHDRENYSEINLDEASAIQNYLSKHLPEGAYPVMRCDLSSKNAFINGTNYTLDENAFMAMAWPSKTASNDGEPLVLVLHSHGTEAYFDEKSGFTAFSDDKSGIDGYYIINQSDFRSTDTSKNIVRVGKVFSDTLNSLGVNTIHCEIMHDKDNYNNSYYNSAKTVQQYLQKYPSIQYVIDIHRDSIVSGDNIMKKPYTVIEDKPTAQIMLVAGTNASGNHPNWRSNLSVMLKYKNTLDDLYPTLSRSIFVRTVRFNQEFLPGCMLLEIGSGGNTLEEAENAAVLAARGFYELLKAN